MNADSSPSSVPVTRVASVGASLAAFRSGTRSGPTVVLVHGFPDDHTVWDEVAARLSDLDVVRYDVRGAGVSTAPLHRAGYRLPRLVDDLVAVLDAVRPDGGPVHLVGHDWGSVQLWAAVFSAADDPRLRGRIASFTSMSGPDLRLYGAFLRRTARERRWRELLGQLRKSWYVAAFGVPWIPERVFSRATRRVAATLVRSQGRELAGHWGPELARNGTNGVELYRANVGRSLRADAPLRTDVPVHLVVALRDDFVTPPLYDDLDRSVTHLRRTEIDAGHWLPVLRPDAVAAAVRESVAWRPDADHRDRIET